MSHAAVSRTAHKPAESLTARPCRGLAQLPSVLVFSVLLGIAFPTAALSAAIVARAVRSVPALDVVDAADDARRVRGSRMLGGSWGCFGASLGLAVGGIALILEGHRVAAVGTDVIALWFAAAGLALALASRRCLRRPVRRLDRRPTLGPCGTVFLPTWSGSFATRSIER